MARRYRAGKLDGSPLEIRFSFHEGKGLGVRFPRPAGLS